MNTTLIIIMVAALALSLLANVIYLFSRLQVNKVKEAIKNFENGNFSYKVKKTGPISILVSETNMLGEKLGTFFAYLSQQERRAEKDRMKLAKVFTVLDDAIIAINADRKVVLFNSRAEKLLNISAEEAMGLSIAEVFTLYEADTELPVHIYCPEDTGDITENGGKEIIVYNRGNLILRTPGNRTREHIVEFMTGRLGDKGNKDAQDVNYIFIIKDITQENRLERLKSDFVTVAAHQLRTPLSAVKWALKMIIDGDTGPVNPEQKSFLMKSYESNERMVTLVNDMLDAEKLESSTAEYNLVPTKISDLVNNLLLEHQPQAQKRGVVITTRGLENKELPMIKVDQDKIRAVLQNLLENSIKYTPPGGMITVGMEKVENKIRVGVTDTGIGIPHEEKEHIFSRFYRGSNAIKIHANGTGLGLFISKRIVEDHGGEIWFESSEGKGTIFYFTLPLT